MIGSSGWPCGAARILGPIHKLSPSPRDLEQCRVEFMTTSACMIKNGDDRDVLQVPRTCTAQTTGGHLPVSRAIQVYEHGWTLTGNESQS